MDKIKLKVLGLSVSQTQTGAYALVLMEEKTERRIPIIIGPVEAQSIAIQLEGLKPPRPLTHDLFRNLAFSFDIVVQEVVIHRLEEGIFYSEIVCERQGDVIRIDSRTSDAVSLALRFNCPIYTTADILEKAGIDMDVEKSTKKATDLEAALFDEDSEGNADAYSEFNIDELNEFLNDAIKAEDYERASEIRDEIKRRQK
ncbi:hypothetical protein EMN47_06280 [Prolixibacteraceae bacterium JC049]|nr:hypothetical protein [Prolixibacteraceae bacterium JC049]